MSQGAEAAVATLEENGGQVPPEVELLDCQWDECTRQFNHLPIMIEHIHNGEHILRVAVSSSVKLKLLRWHKTILVCTNRTTPANGRRARGGV